MTTIPHGIRQESARNPRDSGLNAVQGSAGKSSHPHSSRSVAPAHESDEGITERIRSIPFADALTAVVCRLRPEWSPVEVRRWALTDPRGESAVITAGITGAATRSAKFPAGLAKVGPELDLGTVQLPPTPGEHRRFLAEVDARDCGHGDLPERCPLCRRNTRETA